MSVEMLLGLSNENAKELQDITGENNPMRAVQAAIQFTLMHDKDSVQEALKQ